VGMRAKSPGCRRRASARRASPRPARPGTRNAEGVVQDAGGAGRGEALRALARRPAWGLFAASHQKTGLPCSPRPPAWVERARRSRGGRSSPAWPPWAPGPASGSAPSPTTSDVEHPEARRRSRGPDPAPPARSASSSLRPRRRHRGARRLVQPPAPPRPGGRALYVYEAYHRDLGAFLRARRAERGGLRDVKPMDTAAPCTVIEAGQKSRFDLAEICATADLLYFLTAAEVTISLQADRPRGRLGILQPCSDGDLHPLPGRLARVPSDGIPYPVFVYLGLSPGPSSLAPYPGGASLVGQRQPAVEGLLPAAAGAAVGHPGRAGRTPCLPSPCCSASWALCTAPSWGILASLPSSAGRRGGLGAGLCARALNVR